MIYGLNFTQYIICIDYYDSWILSLPSYIVIISIVYMFMCHHDSVMMVMKMMILFLNYPLRIMTSMMLLFPQAIYHQQQLPLKRRLQVRVKLVA